jgi:hypothetical protein
LFLPNIPSALFYKHLRLLSAPLFAATIEAFQPEKTASLCPVDVIQLIGIPFRFADHRTTNPVLHHRPGCRDNRRGGFERF